MRARLGRRCPSRPISRALRASETGRVRRFLELRAVRGASRPKAGEAAGGFGGPGRPLPFAALRHPRRRAAARTAEPHGGQVQVPDAPAAARVARSARLVAARATRAGTAGACSCRWLAIAPRQPTALRGCGPWV